VLLPELGAVELGHELLERGLLRGEAEALRLEPADEAAGPVARQELHQKSGRQRHAR